MGLMLLLKLTLAPALVLAGTLVGRRWGARAGGFVAGYPNSAGPILLLIALEQGAAFGSRTAAAGLLGLIALAAFNPAYVWVSLKAPIWLSLLAGWSAFVVVMILLKDWNPPLGIALLAALAALNLARISLPNPAPRAKRNGPSAWDLPMRLTCAAGMVVLLTGVANLLGPAWSGMLSPFPVVSSVLAAFANSAQGPGGAARTLRGILLALNAVALFMAVFSWLLPQYGVGFSFVLALSAGALLQLTVYRLTKEKDTAQKA